MAKKQQKTLMKTQVLMKAIGCSDLDRLLPRFLECSVCALMGVAMLSTNTDAQTVLEAPFTRITTGPMVTELSMWATPAWGDYDSDGWLDMFVSTFDPTGKNALFHNNRDGTFSKITTGPIATETSPQTYGAAWADYDNDGWLDLVISSSSRNFQPSRLYRNVGSGLFKRMTAEEVGPLASYVSHGFGLSWADYDRDGYLDLFVANGAIDIPQPDFLFHNQGNGRFASVTNSMTTPSLATGFGGWTDFDNDGGMDLFVAQLATPNELYRTDGQGQFFGITEGSGISGTGSVSVSTAWGDFDNDGDLDLLIVNMGFQGPIVRNWFYRNKGDGTFKQITEGPVAEDQDHFVSGTWVDYDNDGWLDLFVTILGPGSSAPGGVFNRLYHNQGDGTFAMVTTGSLVTQTGNAGGAAWGDYDNDGFLDVCVAYGTIFSPQRNALFRNNGNSNSWIKVKCVGTVSNRSAIGAKVRVKAKIGGVDRWQMRQIGCNQDWVAFNSLDAVIGLGDATVIDTLSVEWPSGLVQEFQNVPVKQTLTLVERTSVTIAKGTQGDYDVTLNGPRQQRYRLESSADLTSWSTVAAVTITNLDGTATFRHTPSANEPQGFLRAVAE
jgi:enediyne biosynthesis protein E4